MTNGRKDDIFKNFREHSVAEFFRKNRQMLGFSGKVRSLTTVVHEFVTNSLDAAEEAGILPEIKVSIKELGKEHYVARVEDNGPGIPKAHIGKALGMMLAGTKFHRYIQQRGQQGIGASGCTMFAAITTGKPLRVASGYNGKVIECNIGVDFKNNAPLITCINERSDGFHGLIVEGEFKEVRYENSNYGVREYLRRTALANPHAKIVLEEPDGNIVTFPRAVETNPQKPQETKPHPLGVSAHDILELAHSQTDNRKVSAFLQVAFSRVTAGKVAELKQLLPEFDFNKKPENLTWEDAENLANAFKKIKWIAPATNTIVPIGKKQIEKSFISIFNPEVLVVTDRSPKVYKGGIPFFVEVGIAYGGGVLQSGKKGEIMRFANRVPLLFDAGGCAITEAVKNIDWGRYGLKNFEEEPIVVLVNLVSVYVPYISAGKQTISHEEEIIDEIKNAVMEAARDVSRYLSGKRREHEISTKKKVVLRYIEQLAGDLSSLADGKKKEELKERLTKIVEEKYGGVEEGEVIETG